MKSHVSMEQHLCEVCGRPYDTGAVLLDRRLCPSMERFTITAVKGKCPACAKLESEGYVALVAAETPTGSSLVKHEDAVRTGKIVHVRRAAWDRIFNCPAPGGGMAYCDSRVIDEMEAKVKAMEGVGEAQA